MAPKRVVRSEPECSLWRVSPRGCPGCRPSPSPLPTSRRQAPPPRSRGPWRRHQRSPRSQASWQRRSTHHRTTTPRSITHTKKGCAALDSCVFGDKKSAKKLFVMGDSHAQMWIPALNRIGIAYKLKVIVLYLARCPAATLDVWLPSSTRRTRCARTRVAPGSSPSTSSIP